jgi:hypothetical protein
MVPGIKKKASTDRYIIAIGIAGALLAGVLVIIFLPMFDADYLRVSIPVTAPREEEPMPASWNTYRHPGIPYHFEYPATWTIHSEALSEPNVEHVTVGTVQMFFYREAVDAQAVAERLLDDAAHNLISFPGEMGETDGTYWARASIVKGTRAAYGQRVYITTHNDITAVVMLPAPPYTDIELRIRESFARR